MASNMKISLIERDFTWPLQQAIYAKLYGKMTSINVNDSEPVPVYDFGGVPKGTTPPYVTIGEEMTEVNNNNKGASAKEITFQIHVWTQWRGMQEITNIAGQVLTILTGLPLDMTANGFNIYSLRKDNQINRMEIDGITSHCIIRFRAMIEDISTVQPA